MLNINELKQKYISILKLIKRENCDIQGLVNWLEQSGFFVSPATTQYHDSEPGGLCNHSLKVYENLHTLASLFTFSKYSQDTEIILGLLHDIYRCQMYEPAVINEKIRNPQGKNVDSLGRFDYQSKQIYKTKYAIDRESFGNIPFNTYYKVAEFIPLTTEEVSALMSYDCGMASGYANSEIYIPLTNCPLVVLLHCADMLASYLPKETASEQTY